MDFLKPRVGANYTITCQKKSGGGKPAQLRTCLLHVEFQFDLHSFIVRVDGRKYYSVLYISGYKEVAEGYESAPRIWYLLDNLAVKKSEGVRSHAWTVFVAPWDDKYPPGHRKHTRGQEQIPAQ